MKSCRLLSVAALFTAANAQTACVADGNGDGTVDVTDLLGLLGQYGGGGSYDTDGSGAVDVTDLLGLLGEFGTSGCTGGGGGGGGGGGAISVDSFDTMGRFEIRCRTSNSL
jgi:hypothetical protein